MFPDASEYPQEKKPLKKVSASQARHEKELKDKITQKTIKNITEYDKQMQDMGFETTLIPPPPPSTTFKA